MTSSSQKSKCVPVPFAEIPSNTRDVTGRKELDSLCRPCAIRFQEGIRTNAQQDDPNSCELLAPAFRAQESHFASLSPGPAISIADVRRWTLVAS